MVRSRQSSTERKSPKKGSFKEAGSSNLRRFGQSIKRIVREVEEKSLVEESRERLVSKNVLFQLTKESLQESFLDVLNSLVTMQNAYLDSKSLKNLFQRYSKLREMIKVLLVAESKWWSISNLSAQSRCESIPEYIERSSKLILRSTGKNIQCINNQSNQEIIYIFANLDKVLN
ncbi:uncharacterized protein LOC111699770 [Eurytemora carolleeae]|uniref:uncharacterized protein LOC111699770 n=1 Tax=Eurytemora carolleeae TaxID=1294199 RepID=UPI000C75F3EC|nr:uncharacterized protein LOC111699770 [Eurytemora carolleeae]|eukprot:XP_023326274.1 uncharacterized protein LOC111699770 [Eurytemora affinis]